jgi:hypothetical protein
MIPQLLAATEDRAASPIAAVVIICLAIAVVLLVRSMNRHLRKLPTTFPAEPGAAERAAPEPPAAAERAVAPERPAAPERADEPGDGPV